MQIWQIMYLRGFEITNCTAFTYLRGFDSTLVDGPMDYIVFFELLKTTYLVTEDNVLIIITTCIVQLCHLCRK